MHSNYLITGRPAARSAASYEPAHFKPVTMDELPKFVGPWEENYAKRQTKYNVQLAAAVAFFTATCLVVYSLDIVDFVDAPPMKN